MAAIVVVNPNNPPRVDLTLRNNADWTAAFELYTSYNPVAPWSLAQEWATSQVYQSVEPASVVVYGGDIYVAAIGGPNVWTSATTFAEEAGNWTLLAEAAGYESVAYDLTGVTLAMAIAKLDVTGQIATPKRAVLTFETSEFSVQTPSNGKFALDLLATRAATLPAGIYGYDALAKKAGNTAFLFYGQITVLQGAT